MPTLCAKECFSSPQFQSINASKALGRGETAESSIGPGLIPEELVLQELSQYARKWSTEFSSK